MKSIKNLFKTVANTVGVAGGAVLGATVACGTAALAVGGAAPEIFSNLLMTTALAGALWGYTRSAPTFITWKNNDLDRKETRNTAISFGIIGTALPLLAFAFSVSNIARNHSDFEKPELVVAAGIGLVASGAYSISKLIYKLVGSKPNQQPEPAVA